MRNRSRKIDRGIITGMNLAITGLSTAMMLQSDFWGFSGTKLYIVTSISAIVVFRTLSDTQNIIRRLFGYGKENRTKKRKSGRNRKQSSMERTPWYEVRYSPYEQVDGDTAGELKTV